MTIGKGFGKIILFGEHFVVYGLPGIVSGVDRFTQVDIEKISENDIIFDDKVGNRLIKKSTEKKHILMRMFNAMFSKFELCGLKITITGNVPPGTGMGYSASLAVAMARAINELLFLKWSDEQINKIAYDGETVCHGTPSGIDNTCATYGGLLLFQKNESSMSITPIKTPEPLYFVIGDTKKKGATKELVNGVRERKEQNPEEYGRIFLDYGNLIRESKSAVLNGDIKKIGALMNQNQQLLRDIGVSSPEIEEIIKISMDNDAIAAKLTGSGGGGQVIVLVPNPVMQDIIAKRIEENGFNSLKTIIR